MAKKKSKTAGKAGKDTKSHKSKLSRKEYEAEIYKPFMRKADGSHYKSYKTWRTHQMSDHLPMWIELHIDFSDAYLETVEQELDKKIA